MDGPIRKLAEWSGQPGIAQQAGGNDRPGGEKHEEIHQPETRAGVAVEGLHGFVPPKQDQVEGVGGGLDCREQAQQHADDTVNLRGTGELDVEMQQGGIPQAEQAEHDQVGDTARTAFWFHLPIVARNWRWNCVIGRA